MFLSACIADLEADLAAQQEQFTQLLKQQKERRRQIE